MRFSESYFTSEYPVDTPDGITLMGKLLKTRIIPVYLAEDDPRRIPEDLIDETWPEDQDLPRHKKIHLPYPGLYRCAETDGKWHTTDDTDTVLIDNHNISIEIIDGCAEEFHVDHYILTSRKDAEDPSAQEFVYQESDGEVTVTGVDYHCERLHIPAVLDGKPVTKVAISVTQELFHLRELVIPDGVRHIDFCWEFPDLEVIQIPEDAVLANPPDWLNHLRWFRNQPDGPVYFQNYYLGTKGMEDAKELILRDGTVGSVRWTDCDRTWEAITFPSSFRHMGDASFSSSADCRLTVPDECTEVKAHFARRCRPKPPTIRRRETT